MDTFPPPASSEIRLRVAPAVAPTEAPLGDENATVSAVAPPLPMPTREQIAVWMPLVHQVVAGSLRKVPANVQKDDLVAAGTYGLIDALRKNGSDIGVRFERYAKIRIRGAILDELRAQDWLTRRARAHARAAVANDAGPAPGVVGFDDLPAGMQGLNVSDPLAKSASDLLEEDQGRAELERALTQLPEREQALVRMHYFHDSPFKDIAGAFGVSEPRISQLHSRAMARLRTLLAAATAAQNAA